MKKLFTISTFISFAFIIASCGEASKTPTAAVDPNYNPQIGEGKFKDFVMPETLDPTKTETGQKVFKVKCSACHKLTDEKLVGPGWKGVTAKRKAAWIMNFITNTDEMINKDPEAQAQLSICLVRMPNQALSDDEAQGLVQFMRQNDISK
jgi:cytochrome c551/c552